MGYYLRRLAMVVAVLMALAAATACTPPKDKADGDEGGLAPLIPEVKVRVAEHGSSSGAGFYVADRKGYFKELGIDIEFVPFPSSVEMLPAVAAGNVDVAGGVAGVGLFKAAQRGLGIKVIADKGTNIPGKSYFDLVIARDKAVAITDYRDLKGRRIALVSRGTVDEIFVGKALSRGGLTRDDVEFVVMESFGDLNAALADGAVDAAMHIEPWITLGEEEGILDRWRDATDFAPGMQIAVVLASPSFLAEQQEAARRFMVAYLKGLRDYHDAFARARNTDEIVRIMTEYTPLEDAAQWKDVHVPGLNPDGYVDKDSLAGQLQWFREQGYFRGEVDLEQLVDHSLVDFAIEQLGMFHPAP